MAISTKLIADEIIKIAALLCIAPGWSHTRKYAKNWGLRVVKVHDIRLLARNVNSERLLECLPILLEGVPPHSCQP